MLDAPLLLPPDRFFLVPAPAAEGSEEVRREERSWLLASSFSSVVVLVEREEEEEEEVVRRQYRGAWRRRRRRRDVGTAREAEGAEGRSEEWRRRERTSLPERRSMAAMESSVSRSWSGGLCVCVLCFGWRQSGHTAQTQPEVSVWVRKEEQWKEERLLSKTILMRKFRF